MNVPKNWEDAKQKLIEFKPLAVKQINLSAADIELYPKFNDNGEALSQLLANLNWYVQKLGDLHADAEVLKVWTDKRYEAEKGIELNRLISVEKMGVTQAAGAKYDNAVQYLDIMVSAAGIFQRVQNARSSARDTTEAIRSRIGQLRGQQRSA